MSTNSLRKFLAIPADDSARVERRHMSAAPVTERRNSAERLWSQLESVPQIRRKGK